MVRAYTNRRDIVDEFKHRPLPDFRPPVKTVIAASLVACFSLPMPAQAQQELPAEGELQSVVVTGTFAKNRRTSIPNRRSTSSARANCRPAGSTELATVLGRLLPSLNFPRPAPTPATPCVRPSCAACRPTRRWCW
jgi:iron complex outermembrane receptor protein